MASSGPPLPPGVPPGLPPGAVPPPIDVGMSTGTVPLAPLPPPGTNPVVRSKQPSGATTTPPPSNVVLLRNIPSHLRGNFSLREWLAPCGGVRTVLWFPALKTMEGSSEQQSSKQSSDEKESPTENDKTTSSSCMALVTMLHGDGAWRLVCAHPHLKVEGAEQMQIDIVSPSPDNPLPPIPVEADEATNTLALELENLWDRLVEKSKSATVSEPKAVIDSATLLGDKKMSGEPLDAERAAAAAGGQYDEEADPLNAPEVLAAVKEFRANLAKVSAKQQEQRIQLVNRKIIELLPEMRQRMERERQQPVGSGMGPLPPPPVPLPPPPRLPPDAATGMPPPPPSGTAKPLPADSGKRGVSNLPAWMTASTGDGAPPPPPLGEAPPPPAPPAGAPEGPPRKRPKLDLEESAEPTVEQPAATNPETHFPRLKEAQRPLLRAFIALQIQEYLGEEEKTLIDFCLAHVMDGKSYAALLEELQHVLEEDAPKFVDALKSKVMHGL